MSKKAFDKIAAGLKDALAIARCEKQSPTIRSSLLSNYHYLVIWPAKNGGRKHRRKFCTEQEAIGYARRLVSDGVTKFVGTDPEDDDVVGVVRRDKHDVLGMVSFSPTGRSHYIAFTDGLGT